MINIIKKHWLGFLFSIFFAEAIGMISSLLAGDIKGKYNAYIKPILSPPDWLFGIVWPILYALMGFSIYLFYLHATNERMRKKGLLLYSSQLLLNFFWSIVFFRFDATSMALLIIILLVANVAYLLLLFKNQSKISFYILIPYLLWLLFATYLNWGIVMSN